MINKLTKLTLISLLSSTLLVAELAPMETGYHFTGLIGWSHSTDSKLKIHRDGVETYSIDGTYTSYPFRDYPYYSFRLEKWDKNKAYGVELIHHKVYLRNPQGSLQSLSVSDGYNFIMFNQVRQIDTRKFLRFGAGLVFAHPDVKFEGQNRFYKSDSSLLGMGHYLAGPGAQIAYEFWPYENKRNYISLETKLTLSYVQFPIEENRNSYGSMSNIAIHFLIGWGSKPLPKKAKAKDHALFLSPIIFPVLSDMLLFPTLDKLWYAHQ